MSNELARIDEVNVDGLKQIGAILAESGYFNSDNQRASAAQLMVKVLAGRELGYGPWASAAGIHIIKGKMTVSANLMADAVKRSGRYDYRIREMTAKRVAIEFFALTGGKPESLGISEFTIEEATAAGLMNSQTWKSYPKNMLFARAMSNGVRWFAPDVFSGNVVYVPEEMGANVDGEGNVIDAPRTVNQVTGEVTYGQPDPVTTALNGNGNGATLDTSKVEKRFHAIGNNTFKKDWDGARAWMLHRYTTRRTPDKVREHTGDMSAAELAEIADTMEQFAENLQRQYKAHKSELAALEKTLAAELNAKMRADDPTDNPFIDEEIEVPA